MNKNDYILNKCKGKDVLDLGCIQDISKVSSPTWLHGKIQKVAKSVIGVDNALGIVGLGIIKIDVEHMGDSVLTTHRFNTIVAGDLIEHLFNAGLFLDSIKALSFDELIITTPNVMSPKYWTLGKEVVHKGHTCWYSMKTLTQLVEMMGFKVVDRSYGFDQRVNGIRPLFKFLLYKLLPQTGNKLLITIQL